MGCYNPFQNKIRFYSDKSQRICPFLLYLHPHIDPKTPKVDNIDNKSYFRTNFSHVQSPYRILYNLLSSPNLKEPLRGEFFGVEVMWEGRGKGTEEKGKESGGGVSAGGGSSYKVTELSSSEGVSGPEE